MKAWMVTYEHEGYATIVHHNHGIAARRLGAEKLDREFEDVNCCRAKHFDGIDFDSISKRDLIEEFGWFYECANCYEHVKDYTDDRVYGKDGDPYCSKKCLHKKEQQS